MNKLKENPWKFPVSSRGISFPTASTETCFGAAPSFLFRGAGGSFLRWSDRAVKVTTHLHQVLTFRMSGALFPFPHMSLPLPFALCLYLLPTDFMWVSPRLIGQTALLCFISYQAFASVSLVTGATVSVIFLSSLGMFVGKCNVNLDSSLWNVEGQGNFLSMLLHFCMKVRGRIFCHIVCLQPADRQGVLCNIWPNLLIRFIVQEFLNNVSGSVYH
jgi:hypothetical protein